MLDINILKLDTNDMDNLNEIEELSNEDIAIIGISANMPMACDYRKYWGNIIGKKDCVREIPKSRLKDIKEFSKILNKNEDGLKYIKASFIDDVDKFDYEFFKLNFLEGKLMDPHQRLFLQTAFEAIEDSGYGGDYLKGSNTGVFVGNSELLSYKYFDLVKSIRPKDVGISTIGNIPSIISSRISYLLDLKGPSLLMDTACSSSLVALHTACVAIHNGDCNLALVGGVHLMLLPIADELSIGIESSSSTTNSFDDNSDGTGTGEGVCAILIKPLAEAIEDNDNIYAVIKGSSINQDGNSIGITAPNAKSQEDVIIKAWEKAGINPEEIDYIEAHGTGTQLGDTIEAEALTKAFKHYTDKKQFCAISSVKSNIGHLLDTSGVASIVKAALALKYKIIPPSINFTIPNREINFEESALYVNESIKKWKKCQGIRTCGISSFGMSGTNCHVVLQEYINTNKAKDYSYINSEYNIFTVSAKTEKSLEELVNKYIDFFDNNKELNIEDVSYTVNTGRGKYKYRLCMVVKDMVDLRIKLTKFLNCKKILTADECIYYNNGDYTLTKTELNDADLEVRELFKNNLRNPSLEYLKIMSISYINYNNIDWKKYYYGKVCFRVSLPTYAFERNRCWVEKNIETRVNLDYDVNSIEKVLIKIFKDELGFKDITTHTNFNELGIDSIFTVKVHEMISEIYPNILNIADYFTFYNIQQLSNHIQECLNTSNTNNIKTKEKIINTINTKNIGDNDVAIIGLDVKTSSTESKEDFWNALVAGSSLINDFSKERVVDIKDILDNFGEGKDHTFSKGGFLNNIDKFDYKYFNISKQEAIWMDPNQRLFLESAVRAINDSGYSLKDLDGSNTGVYVGFSNDFLCNYGRLISEIEPDAISMATTGNIPSILSGRLSYIFNFKGPSVVVDTSCSSSLVAVYTAVKALRTGECNLAVVAGVKINLAPIAMSESGIGIDSKEFMTKAFDDNADGTAIGEGVGTIIIKPLKKALQDGDNIYSVIKGGGLNHDGRSMGLTAPNAKSQSEVLIRAWEDAKINPRDISYIEAHGTGTKLGDPIEISGMKMAFKNYTDDKQFCGTGSLKTNIGHLFEASGIMGVIKLALGLKNKEIPRTINFTVPNRKIEFETSPVYICDKNIKWTDTDGSKICGISGFGFSGTNCHIIMQEPPRIMQNLNIENYDNEIFVLSSKTRNGLMQLVRECIKNIDNYSNYNLRDFCYTLSVGRDHYQYRMAIVIDGYDNLLNKLKLIGDFGQLNLNNENIFYGDNLDGNKVYRTNENQSILDIARIYTSGYNIVWEVLYEGENRKRVSACQYIFEKPRCWIEKSNKKINNESNLKLNSLNLGDMENKLIHIYKNVLGSDEMSINDNFYELGGDSIIAIKISKCIHDDLNLPIDISKVLEYPTILELCKYLNNMDNIKKYSNLRVINPLPKSNYYNVSSSQRRMYLATQKNNMDIAYNIPIALRIKGNIDSSKIEESLNIIINLHESLRTTFDIIDTKVVQVIHEFKNVKLNICNSNVGNIEIILRKFVKPFSLKEGPLFRTSLIKLSDSDHILLFDIHHIISDFISMGILMKEFMDIYSENECEPLTIQYKDFAEWHNNYIKSPEVVAQKDYWLSKFKDIPNELNLPTFSKEVINNSADKLEFSIDSNIYKKIKLISKETSTSVFMILLTSYNILLSKYSNSNDIVVGTPISGRHYPQVENLIGVFINTLPIRVRVENDNNYLQLLNHVKETCINAYNNQDVQFEDILDILRKDTNNSNLMLFNTLFVMQNGEMPKFNIKDLQAEPVAIHNNQAIFDLHWEVLEVDNELKISISYRNEMFHKDTIKSMGAHYLRIMKSICENRNILIKDIDILDEKEINILLSEFNNQYSKAEENCIIDLFHIQVNKTPHNIALEYNESTITYEKLNEKANELAKILIYKGVKSGDIVAIMANRSIDLITGIIAILKVGCAYMPIDIRYPDERKKYMLEDSNSSILITETEFISTINYFNKPIVDLFNNESYIKTNENINLSHTPEDLLYIIYTSGTTGVPKGVMFKNKSLVNLIKFQYNKTQILFSKNVLQFSTICFDVASQEIFSCLLAGGKLLIIDDNIKKDATKLLEFITKNNIETVFLPTAYFKFLASNTQIIDGISKVTKNLIVAGEALSITKGLADTLNKNNLCLHNNYGPSETHVVTTYMLKPGSVLEGLPPIGKPIINTKAYILNKNMKLVPKGVEGELYIAGECLSEGYLNKKELTNQRFLTNPFVAGEQMYKTGDIVKWLPDGNIKYIGRRDCQVKVRGYRIELSEVENEVMNIDDIKGVSVIDINKNDSIYLCCYYTSDKEFTQHKLREILRKRLPDYMIPSYYVKVNRIPLNFNGKVDRKKLPIPNGKINTGVKYEAPNSEIETTLVDIWTKILDIDKIGINDDFYELGGDSLNAILLSSKIRERLNLDIPLKVLFTKSTIKELAMYIENDCYDTDECFVFNNNSKKEIICFPPALGYGFVYNELSKRIPDYKMYCYDFIENDNVINDYVNKILSLNKDKNKEITFIGYSAGGRLAVEIASELQKSGYLVPNIILIDCMPLNFDYNLLNDNYKMDKNSLIDMVSKNMPQYRDFIDDRAYDKMFKYWQYYSSESALDKINSTIHLILMPDEFRNVGTNPITNDIIENVWKKECDELHVYKGYGEHQYMLMKKYVDNNANLILNILKSIR